MKSKVIVIGLSLNRHGGVASVLATFSHAGFFDHPSIIYHPSCSSQSRSMRWVSTLWQWISFVRYFRYRCLAHIHCSSDASFFRKIPYIALCKLVRFPVILNIHPSHFYDYILQSGLLKRKFILGVLKSCQCVGFANPDLIEPFGKILPHQELIHLPNPIDLERYRPGNSPRKNTLLFLGLFSKGKGLFDLIQAVSNINNGPQKVRLTCAGDGDIAYLRKVIRKRGLENDIEINEWVGYEKKLSLYQSCCALVLPSYSEGFPMVVLEAMACGCPVITTPVGGLSRLTDGHQVLFVAPGAISQIEKTIKQLVADVSLQHCLTKNGLNFVRDHDVKNVMTTLIDLYTKFLPQLDTNPSYRQ
ncbi:glycosyltransferase [candidate division KSB1 bacterium]|nr:glycosyltransferase [candidate division KSB1 bacterium]